MYTLLEMGALETLKGLKKAFQPSNLQCKVQCVFALDKRSEKGGSSARSLSQIPYYMLYYKEKDWKIFRRYHCTTKRTLNKFLSIL